MKGAWKWRPVQPLGLAAALVTVTALVFVFAVELSSADLGVESPVERHCRTVPTKNAAETWSEQQEALNRRIRSCADLIDAGKEAADLYFYAGRLYMEANQPDQAFQMFQRGATSGSAKAMTALGYLLWERKDDPDGMLRQFKSAAAAGDPVAQTALGLIFMGLDPAWGDTASRDVKRGRQLLKTAAEQGDPVAHFSLGMTGGDAADGSATTEEELRHLRIAARAGLEAARDTLREKGFEVPEAPSDRHPLATLFERERILMRP